MNIVSLLSGLFFPRVVAVVGCATVRPSEQRRQRPGPAAAIWTPAAGPARPADLLSSEITAAPPLCHGRGICRGGGAGRNSYRRNRGVAVPAVPLHLGPSESSALKIGAVLLLAAPRRDACCRSGSRRKRHRKCCWHRKSTRERPSSGERRAVKGRGCKSRRLPYSGWSYSGASPGAVCGEARRGVVLKAISRPSYPLLPRDLSQGAGRELGSRPGGARRGRARPGGAGRATWYTR